MRFFAILIASSVFASSAQGGEILWDKVEIDMPFAQVKAAYPQAHVHTGKGLFRPMLTLDKVLDGCDAKVAIVIDRKVEEEGAKVERVELNGQGCDSKMFNALLAKYGPPIALNNDNKDDRKSARWLVGGRSIGFKRQEGKGFYADSWELVYEPQRDIGL